MELNIIPECYFDTVLVKSILQLKKVNHQNCCSKVVSTIKRIDDFAVGIVDKDKNDLDYLTKECTKEITTENLVLWKHRIKNHYVIQLAPAIERWVLNAINESNIEIEDLGIPNDLEGLKKYTKHGLVSENEEIKRLCKRLVNSNGATINTLSAWLNYLYAHNRNADINTLKEDV